MIIESLSLSQNRSFNPTEKNDDDNTTNNDGNQDEKGMKEVGS